MDQNYSAHVLPSIIYMYYFNAYMYCIDFYNVNVDYFNTNIGEDFLIVFLCLSFLILKLRKYLFVYL